MAAWFDWAPDPRAEAHPLRLAKDNLTAVAGVLKGTFSKPMPDGKGGTIAPTGKAFAIDMVTVGVWNRRGTMDEEFFFWDNQTFYSKMGLAGPFCRGRAPLADLASPATSSSTGRSPCRLFPPHAQMGNGTARFVAALILAAALYVLALIA